MMQEDRRRSVLFGKSLFADPSRYFMRSLFPFFTDSFISFGHAQRISGCFLFCWLFFCLLLTAFKDWLLLYFYMCLSGGVYVGQGIIICDAWWHHLPIQHNKRQIMQSKHTILKNTSWGGYSNPRAPFPRHRNPLSWTNHQSWVFFALLCNQQPAPLQRWIQ